MKSYIENKPNLYALIHEFLEGSEDFDDDDTKKKKRYFANLFQWNIDGDIDEMHQFLKIIKSIGEHHHHDRHFNESINQLLLHYKNQIKQILSNLELFHIFENNKKIVHFLIQEGIIDKNELLNFKNFNWTLCFLWMFIINTNHIFNSFFYDFNWKWFF